MYIQKCIHGKYVYSTLALKKGKFKKETSLRKEKEGQYTVMYSCTRMLIIYIYRQPRRLRKLHAHAHTHIGSRDGLENYMHT